MDKPKDFYRVLGVERNASTAAIRRAYRRLAKEYHPDSARGASVEAFQQLQQAYETLTDAERRQRYDESLQLNRFAPLSWSFVRSPAAGDLRRPIRPGSLSGEILLTSTEAATGGVLPLDLPLRAPCPACEGTGGPLFDCYRCSGDGVVERRLPVPLKIPPGVRDGTVFQVSLDEPGVVSVLLTVHLRPL
jgi:molecular chaperone DnaJ